MQTRLRRNAPLAKAVDVDGPLSSADAFDLGRFVGLADRALHKRIGNRRRRQHDHAIDIDGGGDQLINWIAEIEGDSAARNDWNQPGDRADFLPIYDSFKFDWLDVGELIRDAETVLEYPMVDKDPVPQWTFGRVTLAGDAAHPMYPRGSNGSAQALIDVRTLADLLAARDDPHAAFAEYEAQRRPATAEIVRTNRVSPPDVINLKVEELVGDRPFGNLDDFISQGELRQLSDRYKRVAGFSVAEALRA